MVEGLATSVKIGPKTGVKLGTGSTLVLFGSYFSREPPILVSTSILFIRTPPIWFKYLKLKF